MDKNKTFKNFLRTCLITIIGLGFLILGQIVCQLHTSIQAIETRIITLEVRDIIMFNTLNE